MTTLNQAKTSEEFRAWLTTFIKKNVINQTIHAEYLTTIDIDNLLNPISNKEIERLKKSMIEILGRGLKDLTI